MDEDHDDWDDWMNDYKKSDENNDEYDDDWDHWTNNYEIGTMSLIKYPNADKTIYIGDALSSENRGMLAKHGIKHIISLGPIKDYKTFQEINYHRIEINDIFDADITKHFSDTCKFIENATSPILVHCQMGISRSVTIVIAYLIYKKIGYYEAIKHVKSSRKCANPNFGFQAQLLAWDAKYSKIC